MNPTTKPRLFIPTSERLPSRLEAMTPAHGEFHRLLLVAKRRGQTLLEGYYNPLAEKFYSWDNGSEVKTVVSWVPCSVDALQGRLDAIILADRANLEAQVLSLQEQLGALAKRVDGVLSKTERAFEEGFKASQFSDERLDVCWKQSQTLKESAK